MSKLEHFFVFSILFHLAFPHYSPIYFQEEEVRHVRQVSTRKSLCDENRLVEFLAELQITNPESIINIAIEDFDSACSSITSTLRKVDNYLRYCTPIDGLYVNLLNGLRTFDVKLCKNNEFYKKYDKYDRCLTDLSKDYEMCNGAPDWMEADQEKVCKIYRKIVDCFYIKTARVCGLKAALTLKELVVEVIDCSLTVKCAVKANPNIQDAMPEKYIDTLDNVQNNNGSKISNNIKLILTILLLINFK